MSRPALSLRQLALPALAIAAFAAVPNGGLQAQTGNGGAFYVAQLEQPTEEARFAAGGVAWTCEGTSCLAARGTARPLRICTALQRKVGPIASFAVNGEALEAGQLARCNG